MGNKLITKCHFLLLEAWYSDLEGLSVAMATALHYSRLNSIWKFLWLFEGLVPAGNSLSLQDEDP